jgi:hypothetical protein
VTLLLASACGELAGLQHGVIARWQALAAGLAPDTIRNQLRSGRWQPLYRGVYLTFTGEPSRMAQLWGAVLRAGPGAALSHHTAAELDKLSDTPGNPLHVTVENARSIGISRSEGSRHAAPIVVHRSTRIGRAIHPARTPPRTRIEETVVDLTQEAASLGEALSWLTRACSRRLTTEELLLTALSKRAKLRWRAELAGSLADIGEGIHSRLEWRYVHDVEQPHGLPRATRQARSRVGRQTRYFDNEYEPYGVVVELDGQAAHPAEARWRDIHRDNASLAIGRVTLRYGWADITGDSCLVASGIAAVLNQRGWPGHPHPCSPTCPTPRLHDHGVFVANSATKTP